MKKSALLGHRSYFDMVHRITLRTIETLSDADLDFRPQPDMRSVRDLIQHIYGMQKSFAIGIKAGRLSQEIENANIPDSFEGQAVSEGLKTIADCVAFAKDCHQMAGHTLTELSDDQLATNIEAPCGIFPAWQYFNFMYDEHWHHRSALYLYPSTGEKAPDALRLSVVLNIQSDEYRDTRDLENS